MYLHLKTLNIFTCSAPPLALLYNNLLFEGKDLSFTIIPSIPNEAALLIIEPMFLGSELLLKLKINISFYFLK